MENNFTKDMDSKLKILGYYQIIGGVCGIGLTTWVIMTLNSTELLLLILMLMPLALYIFSVYCGVLLLKRNIEGLKYSLINQYLQLLNFSMLGITYQYTSGIFISAGIDLTEVLRFNFNAGLLAWKVAISTADAHKFIVNFNFVALFLVFFIEKLKKDH